jgi:catechol 2,3-dioxygenase-like lactoylglutathione lyase family enzyme
MVQIKKFFKMKQGISFLTIGVDDLEKMKSFYKNCFGWKPLKDTKEIVFFKLNGLILALFPKAELAKDIGITQDGIGFKRFALAINCNSEQEVDQTFQTLRSAGVTIIKGPGKVFWGGYSGYIADVEDNYWEIAYNPFLELDQQGNVLNHS